MKSKQNEHKQRKNCIIRNLKSVTLDLKTPGYSHGIFIELHDGKLNQRVSKYRREQAYSSSMQTKEHNEYKAIMIMTTRVDIESKSSLVSERGLIERALRTPRYAYLLHL